MEQVKLEDGNPGKDPAVIVAVFELDGVKYAANLVTGDSISANGDMIPSETLRKMMPPDGLQKIARKVGRVA